MRILLDECVPQPVRKLLPKHHVSTVQEAGWTSVSNGELLRLAEEKFDVFVTSDKNLRYQQNLVSRKIGIIELPTPDWQVLKNLGLALNEALAELSAQNNYIEIQRPNKF